MKIIITIQSLVVLVMLNIQVIGQNKYYLKEQWYTSSSQQFPVNGTPKNVKEYFYPNINNFSGSDTAKFSSYDSFSYDEAGNIVERMLFFDSSFWQLFKFKYTNKGYTIILKGNSKGKITEEIVKKLEQYNAVQFREIKVDEKNTNLKLFSYKNNGNEVLISERGLGKYKNMYKKQHAFYDGQRPLKKIVTDGTDTTITTYYYSGTLKLDSVVSIAGTTRKVIRYITNEKGDPVSEVQLMNSDTTSYVTYSYLYDDKGNWVKRIEEEYIESQFSSAASKNALITRKIIY